MHSLALVGAVDPVLLELIALSLHGEDALVVTIALRPDDGEDGVIRLSADEGLGDGPQRIDIPPPTGCWTCSLREVIVAVVEDRAQIDPDGVTVVLLPPGIETVHLVPGLAADLAAMSGVRLAGVAHAVNVDTAVECLLDHHPLSEHGAALPGDDRCAAEVHVVAVGYADVVVVLGRDAVGRDLVEHLRPHDTLLLPGLDTPLLPEMLAVTHDPDVALARVHPATTEAWGGPHEHGVRTLDLSSRMPFHPGRLRELVADLAGQGMLARGCFWLPSRPGRVCAWEVAGGVVSVGDAGPWDAVLRPADPEEVADGDRVVGGDGDRALGGEAAGTAGGDVGAREIRLVGHAGRGGASAWNEPCCHLVITGVADDEACARVRAAFGAILLRPEEMVEALAWAGAPDGLEDWFGEQ